MRTFRSIAPMALSALLVLTSCLAVETIPDKMEAPLVKSVRLNVPGAD